MRNPLEHRTQPLEVEQLGHERLVVGDGIDDLDRRIGDRRGADRRQVDIRRIGNAVAVDRLGAGVDRVGYLFRRRAAIADIVLDAEVAFGTAGIVTGGKDEAAIGLARADHGRDGGRRQDAVLADQEPAHAVGRRHLQDRLDGLGVVVPAVAADHERAALDSVQAVEHRLHEVLEIVRLLEDRYFLAQAGRAGALAGNRLGLDGGDGGHAVLSGCRRS